MESIAPIQGLDAGVFGGRKVIDVDAHLTEPHDLWLRRAPASLKYRVPQVKVRDGVQSWVIDGDTILSEGACTFSGFGRDGSKFRGMEWLNHGIDEVHPASWSVRERVAVLDGCGISAQILYPNILGFGGQHAVKVPADLRHATVLMFNDAMAEVQAESGGRLYPMALLPWWDVDLAVAEIERSKAMGLRGVNINPDPHLFTGGERTLPDLSSDHWYPIWEVCEAHDIPINFHIAASEATADLWGTHTWPGLESDLRSGLATALFYLDNARVMGNLIFSGLLDRFPRLKFVSVESGIGWIPFFRESLDYEYDELGTNVQKLQRRPSEYFQANFFACFWFERRDLARQIKAVGIDNVLFETDFPHPTCLFPIDDVDEALSGLDEAEKVKVLSANAERVYGISG